MLNKCGMEATAWVKAQEDGRKEGKWMVEGWVDGWVDGRKGGWVDEPIITEVRAGP